MNDVVALVRERVRIARAMQKLTTATAIYLAVVYSKRFWMGGLDGTAFWVADAACFVLIPALLIIWIFTTETPFAELKPAPLTRNRMTVGEVIVFSVLCFGVIFCLAPITGRIGEMVRQSYPEVLERKLSYASKLPSNSFSKLPLAIYFGLTAGIVEEFFFRGALRKIFMAHFKSRIFYVLLSSVVFGGSHWAAGLFSVVSNTLLGLAIASMYLRLNDLRPLMAGHCLYDFYFYLR